MWGKVVFFSLAQKIVDLGFVKFKSNGTKAKRPLEQILKARSKKKHFFVCFSRGFCMDFLGNQRRMNFPEKWMDDGFSWESNGGCKNLGIKRGLQKHKKIITWLDWYLQELKFKFKFKFKSKEILHFLFVKIKNKKYYLFIC